MLWTLHSFENMMIWFKAMPMGFLRVYQNDYKVHLKEQLFQTTEENVENTWLRGICPT